MESERDKLTALFHFGAQLPDHPPLHMLLGFLAGNLDRVHFVRSLEGARVAVRICSDKRTVWPKSPFSAVVRNVPVPLPPSFVSALSETDDPIAVQLDFEGREGASWYQKVLHDNLESATRSPKERAKETMAELRARIDRALDIYRECRTLIADGDPDRRDELQVFLNLAREEIGGLSTELERLKASLQEPS